RFSRDWSSDVCSSDLIATEAKVVDKLRKAGIDKYDLSREEFLKHAWEWTDKHGGIILEQLKKLGASCDWDRTAFTMDEARSESRSEERRVGKECRARW